MTAAYSESARARSQNNSIIKKAVAPWDPCFFFGGGGGQGQYFSDKPKIFSDKPKNFPDDNILNLQPPPIFDNFRQH